jgi:hypothetical protein
MYAFVALGSSASLPRSTLSFNYYSPHKATIEHTWCQSTQKDIGQEKKCCVPAGQHQMLLFCKFSLQKDKIHTE